MSSFMFTMVVMYLMYISKCTASDIYGNVGDDITFLWMLDPIPGQMDIVAVKNPAGSVMFQAQGTTRLVDSAYTERIIYNGNTAAGQMRFTLKSITTADAGLYKASKGAVMYPGQTLYVYVASGIYGNVGDDITFSWMLDPIPSQVDVVAVKNPAGSVMFQAFGTTPIIESQYTDRIVFNGNTTAGQMAFILKSITTADAGLYGASIGAVIYPGQTLYVYGKPTRPSVTAISAPVVNSNLQLNCPTKSTTVPDNHNLTMTYRWNIDGFNITSSTGRYITNGSHIIIQNINLYDGNTTVTCTGTEQRGLTSLTSNVYTVNPEYGPGTATFTVSSTSYLPTEFGNIPDITCSADCKPNCNYRWTKDGQVTSHGSGSTLLLRNINRNDTGVYRCTAWNAHGTKNSTDINVDVKYGPATVTFTPPTTSYSPIELSTVPDITCSADCRPNCNYRWTKGGQVTSHGSGSTLSLRNINRNDTGVYRCTAWNDHGTKNSTDINVDVKYGPGTVTFTPSTTSYSPTELSTIPDITCSADCKPNCNYRWTKDGQVTSHGSGSTLSLSNLNRNDTGVYRCTAWNDHGTKNSSDINVDVKYGPGTVTFTSSTTSYSPTELSTIPDITCGADCKPNCNYRWTKDGQVTSHGSGSTLSLRNINRNDTGVYRCTAWNDYGTKNSTGITVDVKFKPTPSKPIGKVYLFDLYKYTEIKLTYLANPKPEFTWFHDDGYGNYIKQESRLNSVLINNSQENTFTYTSQLTIINLQKEYLGKYRIIISSVLGARFEEIVVAAKGVPHQPTDVKVFCETANTALLIWTSQLNGGKEQRFSIKYWVKEDLKTEISLPTKDPGYEKQIHTFIRQLQSITNYTFVVVARNAHGETVSSRVSCVSQETDENGNQYMPINAALIVGPVFGSIIITILVTLSVIGLVRRKMEKNHNNEERPHTEQGDQYKELDIIDNTNVYTMIEQQGAYENQMIGTETNEFQYEQIQTSSAQMETKG